MEHEGSLLCSQGPARDPVVTSIFYGEDLLAPRRPPKLEYHPLSDVRDSLFNTFTATLNTWRPSPPSATRGRAMPWWKGSTTRVHIKETNFRCTFPLVTQQPTPRLPVYLRTYVPILSFYSGTPNPPISSRHWTVNIESIKIFYFMYCTQSKICTESGQPCLML
jgi:hypothetical protein